MAHKGPAPTVDELNTAGKCEKRDCKSCQLGWCDKPRGYFATCPIRVLMTAEDRA